MLEIIAEVTRAGGHLFLGPRGALLGRRVPPELHARVKAEKPRILAALRRQALQEAGVDPEGIQAVDDLADLLQAPVVDVIRPEKGPALCQKNIGLGRRSRIQRGPRRLAPGEEVRLTESGPWYEVVRVNETAAYLKPIYREPVQVELPNGRTFQARSGGHLIPVAPTAFVVERRG